MKTRNQTMAADGRNDGSGGGTALGAIGTAIAAGATKAGGGKVDAKASADGKVQPQGKPAGSEGAVTDERELIS